MWKQYDNGSTIGSLGNENGTIERDEEFEFYSRITLEKDCGSIPYAITCGVYGWLVHTRFFSNCPSEEFGAMQQQLTPIIELIPNFEDPDALLKIDSLSKAIGEFVDRFP